MAKGLAGLALAVAASPTLAAGLGSTSTQTWSEVDVALPVTPSLSATALGVVREADGLPGPALAGGGVTLDLANGRWTFTGGDLWVQVRAAGSGAALDVNLPLAAVAYSWTIGGVALDERNRLEQLEGAPDSPWRYRNRLLARRPLTAAGPVKAVFASDEVFYDLGRDRWSRNRAEFGLELALARRARFQVYYLRQDDRFGRPGAINALGLTYRMDFR